MFSSISIGSSLHSGKYRPDIDGLRAVAVTAVIICHAFPLRLPGGFVGVDIFFVISGYLISSILIGDIDKKRFSLLQFYDRRVRRIFPALIAVLLATGLIGWFVLFTPEFRTLGAHIGASTLFAENFKLWSESGYFDVISKKKPLLHLWSLAIEEQFYIFWPIILYFTYRRDLRFFCILALLGLASFMINIFDIHRDPTSAYYSPLGRFWELMVGAILAYLKVYRPKILDRNHNLQAWAGCSLIIVAIFMINATRDFPGFWALLPTLGAFFILSAGGNAWINRWVLSARPFVWCGLISYPLYLWHWVLISYGHILYGDNVWVRLGLVVAAVIAATFTFLFIERPFRVQSTGIVTPVSLGAAMLAMFFFAGLVVAKIIPPRLNSFDAPTRDAWQFLRSRTTSFDGKNDIGIYPLHAERGNLALFIGDSHIAQYAERIDKIVGKDSSRLGAILAIGGGCIPIDGVSTADVSRKGCWTLRDRAYQMARNERFETIVIGGAWNWYFFDPQFAVGSGPDRRSLVSPAGESAALARLQQTISQFVKARRRVVLVLDNPNSPFFNLSDHKVRLSVSATNFASNRVVTVNTAQLNLRRRMIDVARQAGATIIDPFGAVCALNKCRATSETGQPLYMDEGHFNPDWAINHADFIDVATVR